MSEQFPLRKQLQLAIKSYDVDRTISILTSQPSWIDADISDGDSVSERFLSSILPVFIILTLLGGEQRLFSLTLRELFQHWNETHRLAIETRRFY
jgi:hypothetical protein